MALALIMALATMAIAHPGMKLALLVSGLASAVERGIASIAADVSGLTTTFTIASTTATSTTAATASTTLTARTTVLRRAISTFGIRS